MLMTARSVILPVCVRGDTPKAHACHLLGPRILAVPQGVPGLPVALQARIAATPAACTLAQPSLHVSGEVPPPFSPEHARTLIETPRNGSPSAARTDPEIATRLASSMASRGRLGAPIITMPL